MARTVEDFVAKVSRHIDKLNRLMLKLDASMISELHDNWIEHTKDRRDGPINSLYFRGSDIQVDDLNKRSLKEMYEKQSPGYGTDEPCPTYYPDLISGLIRKIGEGSVDYIDYQNKYEFYGTIADRCRFLCQFPHAKDEITLCRDIIFNQIRLLNQWKNLNVNFEPMVVHTDISEDAEFKYYFGFGRNVNHEDMLSARRCPEASYLGAAQLINYRFAIDTRGYATVVPSPGDKVLGSLWLVNKKDFKRLDLREGVRLPEPAYRKERHQVKIDGGNIEALIYVSNSPVGNKAQPGYIEGIMEGLEQTGYQKHEYENYLQYIPKKIVREKTKKLD